MPIKNESLENWAKKIDSVFKTLITPVAIIMATTWGFIFYFGGIEIDISLFFYLIGPHVVMFMISIMLWCISCFTKKFIKQIKFCSLIGILITFFMIPFPIIIFYGHLNWGIAVDHVMSGYIVIMLVIIAIIGQFVLPKSS